MNIKSAYVAPIRSAMIEAASASAIAAMKASKTVSCRQGCASCCKRFIPVSLAEALVLVDHLRKNKKWDRVVAAAQEQHNNFSKVRPMAWFKMQLPCPILNQNKCDAYPVRPVACSSHYVASPPEACSPASVSLARYDPIGLPEVHINFMKSFSLIVGDTSPLKIRAPMASALLAADKLSMDPGNDFDSIISMLSESATHDL